MLIVEQSWMLVVEMYEAIGPGFVLALVARAGAGRVRGGGDGG